MNDTTTTLDQLKKEAKTLVEERDWHKFHNAKNLSICIAVEAAELMEHFMWLTDQEVGTAMTDPRAQDIKDEMADIVIGLLCLCNAYNIDLSTAVQDKIRSIKQKYPVDKAKGSHAKYTKYQ